MDSDPKTRRETKGHKNRVPFSAKHIRAHEALVLQQQQQQKEKAAAGKKK